VLHVRSRRRIRRIYTAIVRQPKSSIADGGATYRGGLDCRSVRRAGGQRRFGCGEVPPEQPEDEVGEAAGFAAGNLTDIDDGTPSRTADSVSATAGTSARRTDSLLDNLSRRIVPSWLGWSGRGAVRSDPVALRHAPQHSRGGSRSTKSVDRVSDSTDVLTHPRMYETPRNLGVPSQGQIRQEGAYAAPPPWDSLQRTVRDGRRGNVCKTDYYSTRVCRA